MFQTRSLVRSIFLLTALLLAGTGAAQEFPSRTVKLVSPYAPGGIADPIGRALAEGMTRDLGQPVVVENKPGAGTMIGAAAVTSSPPDGYSLFIATNAMVLNPMLYKKMPYAAKDLKVISLVAEAPLVIVINPKIPATTLKEFVAWAKTVNRPLNYSSVGRGNVLHLATEILITEGEFKMQEVLYSGRSAEALTAAITGEVDMMVTVLAQAAPQVQAGKLRALAVTTSKRMPVLPDVPTTAEAGYPNVKGATWYGLAVHSGTPDAVIDRLRLSVDKVSGTEAFRQQFNKLGLVVQEPRSVADIDRYASEERVRWAPIIQRLNIVLD